MLVLPTKTVARGSAQNRAEIVVSLGVAALGFFACAAAAEPLQAAAGAWSLRADVKPLLQQFCLDCHNPEKQRGDFDLTSYLENDKLHENRKVWEKVVEVVDSREMPPGKKPQPSEAQRETLVRFIEGQLAKFDCKLNPNPGKVTLRRLNRDEYRNTIRDLLGVDYQAEEFPNDEVGYGFDNIADVLSLSPMLMEKFVTAAEEVAQSAIVTNLAPKPLVKRLRGDRFTSANPWVKPSETRALGLYREGEGTTDFQFPYPGEYLFRVNAFGDQAGSEAPKLALRVNGKDLRVFDVTAAGTSAVYEVRAWLWAGKQKIAVAFLNNYHDETNADEKLRGDRNLFVDSIEIVSPPPAAPPLPQSHTRLIPAMPAAGQEIAYARQSLSAFGDRAYRRPATETEVSRLVDFVGLALTNGGTFVEGMQVAVQAALCSPHFLFRWELDPPGAKEGDVRELTDFELASRLSYFLWSSMPDDQLFRLARQG
ncbi:MAG: DUF1587 domain-containing protein, partial [Verrucomicrobiota bacterium]|nr:DUF1587 domain-containing protein [Verrucomicrobiota bacterium]